MAKLKNITPLNFLYVLGNMWEIKFQESSSKNHVIHKVNFMVITKVERLMLPNILQSEQTRITYLESLSNCLSINTSFMNIRSLVPEI